ncbi:MAG: NAD(P)/FAD-dependent oxidoreductase [Euryarchaeota archaeon]|nr:NAD(P)/FAD-dependent oxidoreductase [Euryarchaeota archaeon]MCD6158055.1 NAD(P)/FAD-dependent oxidoreductase [Euryarchaeota archaeon]
MFKEKYDVVVIGAGPAGSSAAYEAAKRGLKVLLIEKRAEVGSPIRCAEGVGKEGLEDLGIKPKSEWIANEVKGARIYAPSGDYITLEASMAGSEVGYVLHRDKFDQYLAKMAVDAGSELYTRAMAIGLKREDSEIVVRIRHFGNLYEVRTPIVIGADGFESLVGEWAGIRTRLDPKDINVTFEYRITGAKFDPNYTEFYIGNEVAPGGYVWIFPKSEKEANVGIGVLLSRVDSEKKRPKYLLDKFLKEHPKYRGKIIAVISGAVSVSRPLEPSYTDNVMLVGDAARMIDPLTGGGIIHAIISGRAAGETAAKAIEKGDYSNRSLKEYEARWKPKIYEKLLRNYLAKEIFVKVSDDVFNKIVDALKDYDFSRINTYELLKAIGEKYPEVVEELSQYL